MYTGEVAIYWVIFMPVHSNKTQPPRKTGFYICIFFVIFYVKKLVSNFSNLRVLKYLGHVMSA